jgi:hypothetical protein
LETRKYSAISYLGSDDLLEAYVIEQVAEERERCAKVAEAYGCGFHNDSRDAEELMQVTAAQDASAAIAAAIRKGEA